MTARIHLHQIQPGDSFQSSRVTVTEAHIVWFAGLTGDFNSLHMDAEAARQGRVINNIDSVASNLRAKHFPRDK